MKPVLIGYFPKARVTRAQWVSPYRDYPDAGFPAPENVEEICSVSACIASGLDPTEWDLRWNGFRGYDCTSEAEQAASANQRHGFDVYAYRVLPLIFRDGHAEALKLSDELLALEPDFELLGYDAVELRDSVFGCSPLSCNGEAKNTLGVNRHCLIASEQMGVDLARHFSISKPEPGPYVAVEVWRRRADRPALNIAS